MLVMYLLEVTITTRDLMMSHTYEFSVCVNSAYISGTTFTRRIMNIEQPSGCSKGEKEEREGSERPGLGLKGNRIISFIRHKIAFSDGYNISPTHNLCLFLDH